jgi:hypothetical protein
VSGDNPAHPPESVAALLRELAATLAPVAAPAGLYAGGSLGSGDFVPGVSDLDLVAVVATSLSGTQRRAVSRAHRRLRRRRPEAAKLHCHYVAADQIGDLAARHPMWNGRKLATRAQTGVARAELLRAGLTVAGPPPAAVLPPVTDEAKAQALDHLEDFAVPAALIEQVRRRRRGQKVALTPLQRVRRAATVRRLVAAGIDQLLSQP